MTDNRQIIAVDRNKRCRRMRSQTCEISYFSVGLSASVPFFHFLTLTAMTCYRTLLESIGEEKMSFGRGVHIEYFYPAGNSVSAGFFY